MSLRVAPRVMRRPISRTWWLHNVRYTLFMLREASSLFLAIFLLLYIIQLGLLAAAGIGPYDRYLAVLEAPAMIVLGVIMLVFALIHTFTWLSLAPAAVPLRLRGKEAPGWAPMAAGLVVWLAISAGVAYVILRG